MKLTTKGKFAVIALLDIAINGKERKPITLEIISKRQQISVSYLEQLFVKLRRKGMVSSYKGPGGGYILAKDTNKISIASIISAVNDDMDAMSCNGKRNCNQNRQCLTHDLWENLTNHIKDYLNKITLLDLVIQQEVREDMSKREAQEVKFALNSQLLHIK